jgi:hypothetical protein
LVKTTDAGAPITPDSPPSRRSLMIDTETAAWLDDAVTDDVV